MQEQARRTVHITWIEAQRAEKEREKLRQARYNSVPVPSLRRLVAAHFSTDLPKLKATALRLLSVKSH